MLGLAPNTAALRKVSLRSAERDVLLLRQRFERALAGVEWMPPGLPPGAILLVRRLSPARREGAAVRSSFGELVSIALRVQASRARRPWLHADAIDAEAVLFSDEAELVACLARDWLQGLVAQRWWWRSVLLDASPLAWLRREVLPRADKLVPAVALLALRAQAAAFIARLDASDCAQAIAVVARTHAVPLVSVSDSSVATPSPHRATFAAAVADGAAASAARRDAVWRLLEEVPEVRRASMDGAQRRLLALALALARAPTWARSPSIAIALDALGDPDAIEREASPEGEDLPAQARSSSLESAHGVAESARARAAAQGSARKSHSAGGLAHAVPTGRQPVRDIESRAGREEPAGRNERAQAQRGDVQGRVAATLEVPTAQAQAGARAAAATPLRADDTPDAFGATIEASRAPPRELPPYAGETAPRVATEFGGLFYLLNAALALGIYSDFTAPRTQGLALSPWDWLAMVGRAWFGDEIVDDPVWAALAGLAGRGPGEEPGRDFEPPFADWFAEQLATLHPRIELALGPAEGRDLHAFVCRYRALLEITPGAVHVHLVLGELPLAIRIAGLDRDPGWIPAAGRDVRFHFD